MYVHFNPRSPCGERRYKAQKPLIVTTFQSTLPVWGATCPRAACRNGSQFQSTLPVWGATKDVYIAVHMPLISIHAPRVGSDGAGRRAGEDGERFQSTLPVWGATDLRRASVAELEFQSTLPVWGATFGEIAEEWET